VLLNSLWRRAPRRLRAVAERHYLLGIWRSGGPPHPETSTNHHRVAAQICLLPGRAGDRCHGTRGEGLAGPPLRADVAPPSHKSLSSARRYRQVARGNPNNRLSGAPDLSAPCREAVQATVLLGFQATSLAEAGAVVDDVLAHARERSSDRSGTRHRSATRHGSRPQTSNGSQRFPLAPRRAFPLPRRSRSRLRGAGPRHVTSSTPPAKRHSGDDRGGEPQWQ
jgi:hypothetical protein